MRLERGFDYLLAFEAILARDNRLRSRRDTLGKVFDFRYVMGRLRQVIVIRTMAPQYTKLRAGRSTQRFCYDRALRANDL